MYIYIYIYVYVYVYIYTYMRIYLFANNFMLKKVYQYFLSSFLA